MISPAVINLLLYVPFVLTVIVTGIIFCIKGYKQGLYRALISFGVTLLSAGSSLLISRLLSSLLWGAVAKRIPLDMFGDMEFLRDLLVSVLSGLVQSGIAILLFGLFFLIFLIVLKVVFNHIKKDALLPQNKGMKWGGLGVRVLDTVIVALLLMIPVYGPLATYLPPVESILIVVEGEDSATAQYLSGVTDNGMVSLYQFGPASWVQGGLSDFKIGDVSVNLGEVAKASGTVIEKIGRLSTSQDRNEMLASIADLSKFLRDEVVEEDWFYLVMGEAKNAMAPALETLSEEEQVIAEQVMRVFDLPPEEFASSGVALLDFVTYSVESGAVDFLETGNPEAIPEDFSEKLSDLMESDGDSGFNKSIVVSIVQEAFIDTEKQEALLETATTPEAREQVLQQIKEEAADKAEEFLAQYLSQGADAFLGNGTDNAN